MFEIMPHREDNKCYYTKFKGLSYISNCSLIADLSITMGTLILFKSAI